MAIKRSHHINRFLEVFRDSNAGDDALCDAAKELIVSQEKSKEITEVLWKRINTIADRTWVRGALITALGSAISEDDVIFPEVVDFMRKKLASSTESEEIRGAAAVSLGVFGKEDSIDLLLEILEQELAKGNVELISSLIISMKSLDNPVVIPALTHVLTIGTSIVNILAVEALGSFGSLSKTALPVLRNLAERGTEAEKKAALKAISEIEEI